jgi:hypothetical protein
MEALAVVVVLVVQELLTLAAVVEVLILVMEILAVQA